MSQRLPSHDNVLMQLPLPLAQLYRRAQNASRPEDRHLHAYYLGEATLKLAASLRIGIALAQELPADSDLARRLEKLCLPTIGDWVGFLRETTRYLQQRPDAALLPLARENVDLLKLGALPAVQAFVQSVSVDESDAHQPLQPNFVRDATRQGVIGFFTILAHYRNKVIGHGAPKLPAYYERVGPLFLDAICEVLQQPCLFGPLTLAVCRLSSDPSGRLVEYEWRRLVNLGSLPMPREDVPRTEDETGSGERVVPGHVYFVGRGTRISLHPLAVYLEDRSERERVAFLNDTVISRQPNDQGEAVMEVRRCEYLDYATGDHVRDVDVRAELTRLLAQLRGQAVSPSEVQRLATASQALPPDRSTIPAPGALLGDFELLGELGRGAMGVVYRARQRSLDRIVALKVLPPSLAADPILVARFWREIAALARCEHPNLVKIITSGSDGDRHYYAMELVEGADLAALFEILRTGQPCGPLGAGHLTGAIQQAQHQRELAASVENDAARVDPSGPPDRQPAVADIEGPTAGASPIHDRWARLFAAAADGLVHLHARGIIHRDLKPGNLMLTRDGQRLVIMDLGLAQLQDRTQALTQVTTRWLGTLRYCAPEQLQWNLMDVDERADIYGFGAALYELITLRPLFDGDSEARLIEQILHEEPRALDLAIPRDLTAIVMQCLEKDRSLRYASAQILADDLRRYVAGQPVSVRPLTKSQRLWRWCRNNRRVAALTALVATLLVVVSIGATSAAIMLARLLAQTRTAERKALVESLRVQAEQLGRQELEESENSADFALIKEQIRADRFLEAGQTLSNAVQRADRSEALARRRPAWQRITRVVSFYRANDAAWNLWGEEDYAGVMAAAGRALIALGVTEEPSWWTTLPTRDLDVNEQDRFEREVYRMLMLHSAVHTVAASMIAEFARGAAPGAIKDISPLVHSALKSLQRAQAWEWDRRQAISLASHIMEQINLRLLQAAGEPMEDPVPADRAVQLSDTDYYFLGLMHFVIERNSRGDKATCPHDPHGPAEPPRDEAPTTGSRNRLLSSLLDSELARHPVPRGASLLATSERLLRIGAGRELRYWPSFALGRTLYFEGKYGEAELAFSTCASLRPDYARSYEQRALMFALQANATEDEFQRTKLRELAWEDSQHAMALAERARDPATWWPRGDLLVLLGRPADALSAYAQAMERDDTIREKINRRNNLACVRNLALAQIEQTESRSPAWSDAKAVLALANVLREESPDDLEEARRVADEALRTNEDHPHARTARGLLALRTARARQAAGEADAARQAWESALADFERALPTAPDNYQAACGRAMALEELDRIDEALAAWSYLVDIGQDDDVRFGPSVALTDAQRAKACLGQARMLRRQGRSDEARQAEAAAQKLAPEILDGTAP